MFLICVKVHLNTERIPPIDEPRGRLWGSAAPITQSGETLWCCFDYPELSCPVRSLLLREAARFLVRGLPFFCLFFCQSGLHAGMTQNGTAHEEGSPVQFVERFPQGISGSGRSLVRSVCSVLLGCRIFFEHFKESLLFAVAAELLEETCNHSAGDIVPERTHR